MNTYNDLIMELLKCKNEDSVKDVIGNYFEDFGEQKRVLDMFLGICDFENIDNKVSREILEMKSTTEIEEKEYMERIIEKMKDGGFLKMLNNFDGQFWNLIK